MAYACNPTYLGGRDQENHSSNSIQKKELVIRAEQDPPGSEEGGEEKFGEGEWGRNNPNNVCTCK
jgi:hypothetical protein